MKEVSCRALDPYFRAADKRGIPRRDLIIGVPYPLSHLQNKNERVEWDVFRAIMTNCRRYFSDADFVEIGAVGLHSPLVRSFVVVGRTLLSPIGFYKWVLGTGGPASQLNTTLVMKIREVGAGRLDVDITTAPGYEPCREYYLMAAGGMKELPRLLGLDRAKVEMREFDRGITLEIELPPEKGLRPRLFRILSGPLNARAAAADLAEALRSLESRYAELEDVRNEVDRQRRILDDAYRLAHAIWGGRDPAGIAKAITHGLIEVNDITGARLTVDGAVDGAVTATAGVATTESDAISVELLAQQVRGRIDVWLGARADRDAAKRLLDLLAPTVALAVDNALAYRELSSYQRDLERLVEERTAELRNARDDLAVTVQQLQEAQGARERIFANISHEIRTPLSIILLAVADVESRVAGHLDAQGRAALDSVVESTRKLLRLVDELLLVAAGRETALRLSARTTDVGHLLSAMAATWRPAVEGAGLALEVRLPASLVAVVDPAALERVVSNLLSNAVKYTPRGGKVSLDVGRERDEVVISVADTGIGIDDDLLQRLFGRFERGAAAEAVRGGSGIGLSLVRELVEAHGGSVSVDRLSPGTQFTVRIPIAATTGAAAEAATPRLLPTDFGLGDAPVRSGDVFTSRKPGATILVAEDEPQLAARVAQVLSEEHTVVVALDGESALDLAAKHQPHLLVTDVNMPGIDGIELTRRFREVTGDKLSPVVVLSALADLGTRIAGLEAGAVDYVVKPFDPAELKARVRSQLTMRDLAVRLHRAEQLSALGTLSSGLAHELRNPANAIVNAVGPLKMLLPDEAKDPESPVGQLLDVLGSCAEQIGFLSRQLLSFRRGGELDLRVVPIGDVMHRALTLAAPALRGVTVKDTVDAAMPIRCAPPLLVQVLTNLLENAAQAAGAGGWVEVAASNGHGSVRIEVTDSGPGVPAELRERVFEPFFTTKPPGVGSGLGLPLARDIVHRHGGVLEIRDRDRQPIFVIELPAPETRS